MFCPNCGYGLNGNTFCSNCGIEIVYINDNAVIKKHYLEVKTVYDEIDSFIVHANSFLDTISKEINNEAMFAEFNRDLNERNDFLNSMSETEASLLDFRKYILDILNDSTQIDYLRSMNYIFGDADNRINNCLSLIDSNLDYINRFRNKINDYWDELSDNTSDSISNADYLAQVDKVAEKLDDVQEEYAAILNQQDIYDHLRNEEELRKEYKECITETLGNIENFEVTLNDNLNDRKKLNELKKAGSVSNDVEEKLRRCQHSITECKRIFNELLGIIDKIERPDTSEIELNKNRIIDI